MSWTHLKTFLWLRWRLSVNRSKRSSTATIVIDRLRTVLAVVFAAGSLVISFLFGQDALADAPPVVVMLTWDATVAAYIVIWLLGLMTELQQSELLSLDRFLHLPVSPAGAFLMNYVGSSLNLSTLLFLPAMVGLSAGLLASRGAAMSALLVLVPCFFLMMTAVTHQFRGWLASMMANRRRRQTILVIVSAVFMSMILLPRFADGDRNSRDAAEQSQELAADRPNAAAARDAAERFRRFESRVRLINAVAPPGWLAHGAREALEGNRLSVLAAALGMSLIGAWSLMRSYRTTVRLYKGEFSGRSGKAGPAAGGARPPLAEKRSDARRALTEKSLPLISEHASAIAVTCFRSLLRSPEAKLALLTPLFLVVVFSGMFANLATEVSPHGRSLRALGIAVCILLLTMLHFVGNQFAYDRDGFRSFVLSPAPRRDVLLGKNLSFLPLALAFMVLAILAYHWFYPLRADHLVAVLLQTISIYFAYCLLGNILSIYVPIAIRPTNGMPIPGQGANVLLQTLALFVFWIPLSVALVPLGVEYAMHALDWHAGFPAFLVLSLVQAALTLYVYRTMLESQGLLLQRREQRILEVVTRKVD